MAAVAGAAAGGAPPASAPPAAQAAGAPDADAFRLLYPKEYLENFLKADIRADSRQLGRARAATVALGVVSSAQGSALAKIGRTSMLAGVKAEVCAPPRGRPGCGLLTVTVELTPLCSAAGRPGRPSDEALDLTARLAEALHSAQLVDPAQLCILEGQHAWCLHVDVYCLDADGSLFDAALLAAVAALTDVRLPAVSLRDDGRLAALGDDVADDVAAAAAAALPAGHARRLTLGPLPLALTCALYKGHLLVDPSRTEEEVARATVTVALDAAGTLLAVHKPGGEDAASERTLMRCVAAARLRHAELTRALRAAADAAGGGAAPMDA